MSSFNRRNLKLLALGLVAVAIFAPYAERTATAAIQALAIVAAGGTGRSALAAHSLLIGNATSPVTLLTPGAINTCLVSNGPAADPGYIACPGGGGGGTAGSPLFVQTSSATVSSMAETTLLAAGEGSLTIPANWFTAAGTVLDVCYSGFYSTGVAPGTIRLRLKFGATVVADTGAAPLIGSVTTLGIDGCLRLTARTVGAGGTIMANNLATVSGGTAAAAGALTFLNASAVTVDTTVTQLVDFTVLFSAAGNSITLTNFYMAGPGSAVSSVQGLTGAVVVTDVNLSTSNVATNNCSITKHGFTPIAPNDATKFLDGTCTFSTPPAGSGTVNTGTAGQISYYAANGNAVSGASVTGAVKAGNPPTQAACADLSNGAPSCSTDTTNAANINSGQLGNARYFGVVAKSYVNTDEGRASATPGALATPDVCSFTLAAVSNVLMTYQATTYNTSGGAQNSTITAVLDGVNKDAILVGTLGGSVLTAENLSYLATGLSAAAHTIQVFYSTNGGTAHWANRGMSCLITP
jgi:hypothetical protein